MYFAVVWTCSGFLEIYIHKKKYAYNLYALPLSPFSPISPFVPIDPVSPFNPFREQN